MEDYVISVEGLRYNYGKITAVDDISFNVEKGQIFSFLGPNGAGKTTTINILTTLMPIQNGKVTIAGYDLEKQQDSVRKSIGIVFQNQTLDWNLSVWETLLDSQKQQAPKNRRTHQPCGSDRKAKRAGEEPQRRHEAPPRNRTRTLNTPKNPFPRRTHHRA